MKAGEYEGPSSTEPDFNQVTCWSNEVVSLKCCFNPQSLLSSLSNIAVEKVPVVRKLIYAVGTLPYALTLNIIGFYFNVFLLDVALVSKM